MHYLNYFQSIPKVGLLPFQKPAQSVTAQLSEVQPIPTSCPEPRKKQNKIQVHSGNSCFIATSIAYLSFLGSFKSETEQLQENEEQSLSVILVIKLQN